MSVQQMKPLILATTVYTALLGTSATTSLQLTTDRERDLAAKEEKVKLSVSLLEK